MKTRLFNLFKNSEVVIFFFFFVKQNCEVDLVRFESMRRSCTSLHPLSASTPEASIWLFPKQMPGPSPSP